MSDSTEFGRSVHRWAANQMGRLVREGFIDEAFLGDYLGVEGGSVADAVRIAELDDARPILQLATALILERPIVVVSKQYVTFERPPTVIVYAPGNGIHGREREPIFVAHEYHDYGNIQQQSGGAGHYMILRRKNLVSASSFGSHAVSSDDAVDKSNVTNFKSKQQQVVELRENISSNIIEPEKRKNMTGMRNELGCKDDFNNRKRKRARKFNRCITCKTFISEGDSCSVCRRREAVTRIIDSRDQDCQPKQLAPDIDENDAVGSRFCRRSEEAEMLCKVCDIDEYDVFGHKRRNTYKIYNEVPGSTAICCDNCLRSSTKLYPFTCKKVKFTSIIKKKYIVIVKPRSLTASDVKINLCPLCAIYLSSVKLKATQVWGVAWPSFIAFFLVRIGVLEMWRWLPLELRIAWLSKRTEFHRLLQEVTLTEPSPYFVDCTFRRQALLQCVAEMRGASLRKVLDKEAVAQVRCHCGAQEFLEDAGSLPLDYALNREISQVQEHGILSRGVNKERDLLTAARGDWLLSWRFLDKWRIGPCVMIDEVHGFCLLTCREHKGGSRFRHASVGYNPVQYNSPCSTSDRLGSLVVAPQVIKPLVKRYNVNSYEVLRVTGSYSGMSSCMLQTKPRWDITSKALAESERVQLACRTDVFHRLQNLVSKGELSADVRQQMQQYSHLSASEMRRVRFCQQSATKFDIDNLLECRSACNAGDIYTKNHVNVYIADPTGVGEVISTQINYPWPSHILECSSNSLPWPMTFCNARRKLGIKSLWILGHLLCSTPCLWKAVSDSVRSAETEHWVGHVLRFISVHCLKKDLKALGRVNPYRKILNATEVERYIISNIVPEHRYIEGICNFLSAVDELLCNVVIVDETCNISEIIQSTKKRIILLIRSSVARSSSLLVPLQIESISTIAYLRFIGFAENPNESQELLFRGECCIQSSCSLNRILNYNTLRKFPSVLDNITSSVKKQWSLICYEQQDVTAISQRREKYLSSFTDYIHIRCMKHNSVLSRDYRKSTHRCSYDTVGDPMGCQRLSFVRCITAGCSVALCKKHFYASREATETVFVGTKRGLNKNDVTTDENRSADFSLDQTVSDSNSLSSFRLDVSESERSSHSRSVNDSASEDSNSSFTSNDELYSDGSEIPYVDNTCADGDFNGYKDEEGELLSIPRHVILNVDSRVLRRNINPIRGNISQRRFLQNIVSVDSGQALPLINFEADIFPSIFYFQRQDGLFPGALPQFLFSDSRNNHHFGFAGIDEILRCRVKDGASLMGTDPRYIAHVFDVLVNLELNTSDTRLVESRGYEHLLGYYSHRPYESRMSFDSVDSRMRINELAAFTKLDPEFFYTHTVSMRHHLGVSPIYLRAEELGMIDNDSDLSKARDISVAVQLIRSSSRAVDYVWQYILRSEERPLGEVDSIWYRSEWQSDPNHAGNIPHTHGLIKVRAGRENPTKCLEKIICSSSRLFHDKRRLLALGLFETELEVEEVQKRATRVQQHSCRAAGFRCHKVVNSTGDTVCRTPLYPASEKYSFQEIKPKHAESAEDLLIEMGVASRDNITGEMFWEDMMIGGKYFYPSDKNEHFIPTSSHLWALHRSQCNLLYCDRYRRSKYIAKYIAAADAKGSVFLKPKLNQDRDNSSTEIFHDKGSTDVIVDIKNENIKCEEFISKARKRTNQGIGRVTPFTEIVYHVLQLPTLYCNLDFLKISTVPFENRSGVHLKQRITETHTQNNNATTFSADLPECIRVRQLKGLPQWRQHTASQRILLIDRLNSKVSLDKITLFSLRPPELLIFGHAEQFFSWFFRVTPNSSAFAEVGATRNSFEELIGYSFPDGFFVDMLGAIYLVRESCLFPCVQYLTDILHHNVFLSSYRESAAQLLDRLFLPLARSDHKTSLHQRYVSPELKPIIVNSNITPSNESKFLIHLALSLGFFETELDLFRGPSIRDVFIRCGLLEQDHNTLNAMTPIISILRQYVVRQLLYYPTGGTHAFDAFLVAAHAALDNALNDISRPSSLPGVLSKALHAQATADLLKLLHEKKLSTVQAALAEINLQSPTETDFMNSSVVSPLNWNPRILASPHQSIESVNEQQRVFEFCKNEIDKYLSASSGFSRFPVIVGGPGVGKTFLLTLLGLFSISRGLVTLFTSLQAETSVKFGGLHLHHLLPIPVVSNSFGFDVDRLAEKCILSLGRNPLKLALIREINVLCIEELGLISAELLAVVDRCFRVARKNSSPYGGVLLLCSMDPVQLPPIQGHPLLTSPVILVTFRLIKLSVYVRSATDKDLQRINEIGRVPNLHLYPDLIDEYCEIISNRCNFAPSFASVPHNVLRVVGKRVAEQEVIRERDDYIRRHVPSEQQCVSKSIDVESTSNCIQWKHARKEVVLFLNKKCLEPDELRLVPGIVMRITQNDTINRRYSQGQLCVISRIPTLLHDPVHVFLAPAGYRELPDDDNYEAAGWQEIKLSFPAASREVFIRQDLLGQRLQYPLRPFFASTVHRCMGSTLPSVCAKLSLVDMKHELWMRPQLYTLFSRVKRLDDITLIGKLAQTLDVIRYLLNKVQQFDEYVSTILDSLDMDPTHVTGAVIQRKAWPFRYHVTDLPETSSVGGCVYLLLSMNHPTVCYIGSSLSIKRRIREHNRRQGAAATQDPALIPWFCAALITGFDAPSSHYHRYRVESMWQNMRPSTTSPDEMMRLGELLTQSYADRSLIFHRFVYY